MCKCNAFINEAFILSLLGRDKNIFISDLRDNIKEIEDKIRGSSFLVIGGAGSIGSATVKEIFKRNPKLLHVVDISENNLAELVRDLRSSFGYTDGDFKTFALDISSDIYDVFIENFGKYDYILNFSALKHVRSEKDPYTLMRMIEINILSTIKTIEHSIKKGSKKYFCVSTDKATNPVNLMGASKRVMELFLIKYSDKINISSARFANVAFSDGSLLHSFIQRIQKRQPITAPDDVKRYFITPLESGVLCLMSTLLGDNLEIFFPKLSHERDMLTFWEIAKRLLESLGYEPYICETEEEARILSKELPDIGKWPCYISKTDTTGEKEYEEFFSEEDKIDWNRFIDIGVIRMNRDVDVNRLDYFLERIGQMRKSARWNRQDIIDLFQYLLPEFKHKETGKFLDEKM